METTETRPLLNPVGVCGSGTCRDFTVQTGSEAEATAIDLSNSSINEEDIDPFTYHPPFTKWDYLKVWRRLASYLVLIPARKFP